MFQENNAGQIFHKTNIFYPLICTPDIIYRTDAHSKENKDHNFYFGVAQTPVKKRFRNHNRDFNQDQYIESTELSKYIWSLKDAGTSYTINWSVVAKVKDNTKISYCPLCLSEKYHFL